MRKLIIAGMAVAMLAIIPAAASADVARRDATVAAHTTVTTATLTVNQSKDTVDQFTNVWRHEFSVVVLPDGSFSGTAQAYDNAATTPTWTETVTGKFNTDKTAVSFDTIPVDGNGVRIVGGATFQVTNAPMNNTTVPVDTNGTWTANKVE